MVGTKEERTIEENLDQLADELDNAYGVIEEALNALTDFEFYPEEKIKTLPWGKLEMRFEDLLGAIECFMADVDSLKNPEEEEEETDE